VNRTPEVAVIIPTRDRMVETRTCLEALGVSARFSGLRTEVILVDDGSRDGTVQMARGLARRWKNRPALRIVSLNESHGPAGARNIGVKSAQAPVIVFLDSDCIPAKKWLSFISRRLVNESLPLVIEGRTERKTRVRPGPYDHVVENLHGGSWLTCNLAMRRNVFVKTGGFDERFNNPHCREDSDLAFKLIEQHCRMDFEPGAVVMHPVKKGHPGKFLRESIQGIHEGLLFFRHPLAYLTRLRWFDGLFMPAYYLGFYAGALWLVCAIYGVLPMNRESLAGMGLIGLASLAVSVFARIRKRAVTMAQFPVLVVETTVVPFTRLYWVSLGLFRACWLLARGEITSANRGRTPSKRGYSS